jgi:hypothetical protein
VLCLQSTIYSIRFSPLSFGYIIPVCLRLLYQEIFPKRGNVPAVRRVVFRIRAIEVLPVINTIFTKYIDIDFVSVFDRSQSV